MSMIAITKGGRLYESDPARKDGLGMGRLPSLVDESSTVLSNPRLFSEQQARMRKAEGISKSRLAAARNYKKVKALETERQDNINRARMMSNQKPVISRADKLIKGELMRQQNSNADFFQYERLADTEDFGRQMSGRADFQTYSIAPSGSPLTRDGSYGPVTDFDRYVQGKRFARGIPSGMSGYQPQMGDWWSELVDKGQEELQKLEQQFSADPLKTITTGLVQAGVIEAPKPPSQPPAVFTRLPAAAQQYVTGDVTIFGTKFPKWWLTVGATVLGAAGLSFAIYKMVKK